MIKLIHELYGRQINVIDVDDKLLTHAQIKQRTALKIEHNLIYCFRCGLNSKLMAGMLPNQQFYCPRCINLGRMTTDQSLCYVDEPNDFELPAAIMTWAGQLTATQNACAQLIIEGLKQRHHHLLWAVTGAGKTEMLFPGIEWAIKNKLRIAIASPRVDVCIELFPRIQAAFAHIPMILLHGRQTEKYQYSQLTICTTHQLLRFYHAFDILIIDEVDSFPYAQDAGLHYAADQAIKSTGVKLFLTATPSDDLLKMVKHDQLKLSYLPLRFHRHLLPQIKRHYCPKWREQLTKRKLPKKLLRMIRKKILNRQRFLLFLPHVKDLRLVQSLLQASLATTARFTTVHSADSERIEKVAKMRNQQLDFLLTTTILERGVTFAGIDVIVLGADDDIFSPSALVQIAGRVGRSNERPFGNVDFFIHSNTNNIGKAVAQIAHMNRLGAQQLKNE